MKLPEPPVRGEKVARVTPEYCPPPQKKINKNDLDESRDCGRRLLTCVVHVGPGVEGGCAAGLDLPPGAGVLGRPAAEGRVVGQAKVAGEPKEGCQRAKKGERSAAPT